MDKPAPRKSKHGLRAQAEQQGSAMSSPGATALTPEQALHELQVHQIELELQNEELRRAQLEIEAARDRYLDLYDFAPVGYLTLEADGRISGANLTACGQLRVERRSLLGQRIVRFLAPADAERWQRFQADLQQRGERQRIELALQLGDASSLQVQLDCMPVAPATQAPGARTLRLSVVENVTERERAAERLRAYAAQVSALNGRLLTAQDEERRRIARELHDEIGQVLSAVLLALVPMAQAAHTAAERDALADAKVLVQSAVERVRSFLVDLRPPVLDDMPLPMALRALLEQHGRRANMAVSFHADEDSLVIPRTEAETLYRVAQELLTNVARHSQASRVEMDFSARHAALTLQVRDDGVGFDPAAASSLRRLGIVGMHERMRLHGGTLTIDSAPQRGTLVQAQFVSVNSGA